MCVLNIGEIKKFDLSFSLAKLFLINKNAILLDSMEKRKNFLNKLLNYVNELDSMKTNRLTSR